jgi:hypothetical protein
MLDHEPRIFCLAATQPVEHLDRPGDERYPMTMHHEATQ